MIDFHINDRVAIHYSKDKDVDELGCFHYWVYDAGARDYKRVIILDIKRHWFYLFKWMYLCSDGHWYSKECLTPIFKVCGTTGKLKSFYHNIGGGENVNH